MFFKTKYLIIFFALLTINIAIIFKFNNDREIAKYKTNILEKKIQIFSQELEEKDNLIVNSFLNYDKVKNDSKIQNYEKKLLLNGSSIKIISNEKKKSDSSINKITADDSFLNSKDLKKKITDYDHDKINVDRKKNINDDFNNTIESFQIRINEIRRLTEQMQSITGIINNDAKNIDSAATIVNSRKETVIEDKRNNTGNLFQNELEEMKLKEKKLLLENDKNIIDKKILTNYNKKLETYKKPNNKSDNIKYDSKYDEMIFISEGEFIFGDSLSKKVIKLKSFYIDKFEVTNIQYKRFNYNHEYVSGEENFPVVNINFSEAKAYAEWAGKRIPTEEEWEKAARGKEGLKFPWGNTFDASKCNTINSSKWRTVSSDEYQVGRSPYGVLNMLGNVWEWTDSQAGNDPESKIIKGGSFINDLKYISCSSRSFEKMVTKKNAIGFRCVKDFK